MQFESLQMKLMVIFGLCVLSAVAAVVFSGIVSTHHTEQFVIDSSGAVVTAAAKELLFEKARAIGLSIEVELEVALDSARTIAHVLSGVKDPKINLQVDRDKINGILQSVLERNPQFLAAYTLWEPNALDGLDDLYVGTEGHDQSGRFIPYWSRGADGKIRLEPLVDYENQEKLANGVRKGEYYLLPRERKRECGIDPYPYPVQGQVGWMTSLIAPIFGGDAFYGIAGIDMRLDFIQTFLDQIDHAFYGGASTIAVISHNGILAAVSEHPELVGKPLKDWRPDDWQQDLEAITSGQGQAVAEKGGNMEIIVPVKLGRTEAPWAVLIRIPTDMVLADVQSLAVKLSMRGTTNLWGELAVGLGVTIAVLLMIGLIARGISRPLKVAAGVANQIAEGNLEVTFGVSAQDEVGQVLRAMKKMILYFQEVAGVAEKVSNKNLQVTVMPKSEHDVLNHSLAKMVANLRLMRDENEHALREIEQRNHAMQQQNWLKDGVSQLGAALAGDNALTAACQKAVNFTARYVGAGQGVLYVYEADKETLQLYGSFAFTERDEVSNTYQLGEGVIGQVALERIPILLKHVSPEQRLIQTGTFGGAPLNTYTLPLLYENELYGVFELGAFEPFDQITQAFLTEANRVIATAIFSTAQRERVQALLRRSQEAAQEAERTKADAQQQTEEARKVNVLLEEKQQELEQQSEELQQLNGQLEEREQQLRQQQEELRQQNETLQRAQAEIKGRARELNA